MPTPGSLATRALIEDYIAYARACSYANQWLQAIQVIGAKMQANPLYATDFSSAEQTAISANISAAAACNLTAPAQPASI